MNIFYATGIEGDLLLLDEQESQHCIKVLRSREGDKVWAVDGEGGFFDATIYDGNSKNCKLQIRKKHEGYHPLPYELHIGIAPTKSMDRFEWFLEKATEIGISSITPLICERSERKVLRLDRIEKVVVSAMKQSMKAFKPVIHPPVLFKDWLSTSRAQAHLIAHCIDGEKQDLWKMNLPDSVSVSIGPEGDFSENEIEMALRRGYEEISLGDYRLRTETAGIVACSAVYFNKNQ